MAFTNARGTTSLNGSDGFNQPDRRPELCRRLSDMVNALKRAKVARAIIVDGSFVTGADEPNDVDLLIILPADWNFHEELPIEAYNLLSKKRVRRRWGFDILVACEGTPECVRYAECFQGIRNNSSWRKGVLRLQL
jgi:uncharacterized protein DUF6932